MIRQTIFTRGGIAMAFFKRELGPIERFENALKEKQTARQNAQPHRFFKGVQQGDLTFNETLKLEQGQQRIRNMKNQAKASGGVVTPLERARIHAAQNIQSARIFLKRHN